MSTEEREPLLNSNSRNSEEVQSFNNDGFVIRLKNKLQNGRFTTLEKLLFVVSIGLFVFLAVFVGLYVCQAYDNNDKATPIPPTKDNNTTPLCLTPECVLTAAQVLQDIDQTVDPCEDFYAYTCNNWKKNHAIPEGESVVRAFTLVATENKKVLRHIITQDFTEKEGSTLSSSEKLVDKQNFYMVKNLYDSCINEDAINAKSTEPILPLLKEIRTIYSIDKNGNKPSKKQFTKAMVASFQYGIAPFFQFNIDADPKRPAINSIQLVQSGLTLPSKEYYKNENVVDTLLETVEETIQLIVDSTNSNNNDDNKIFGGQEHDVKKIAKSIVDFEKELASLSDDLNDVLDRTKTYNPLTLSELTKLSPIIDWELLLTDLQPPSTPHQDTVIVNSPTYIGNITVSLIEKAAPETILGYLLWRVVDGYVVALGEDIRKPSQKLNAVLQGTNAKVTQPRWEICLKQVDESVGFLAGRLFVQAKFSDQEKKRADNFFQSLKESFVDRLHELPWLDDSTREKAIEKVNKLVLKIGYPTGTPDINSPVSLSEYYSGLELNGKDYFGNYLASQRFNTKKAWEGVGKETDKSKWIMNPQDVNAYCNPSFNEIVVPAGILQYPLFGPNYPDYLQYGGIGMVIGHELTHGFDNAGRHYDGEGRLAEWWTDITANAFDERAQCFIDQYSNYTIDTNYGEKLHINGKQTLGENIADNGGLSEAYIAWKRQYDSDKQSKKYNNPLLPGLQHLTPNQLFFINFGRIWCNNMTKEAETQWVLADEHSPPRWRVNGVIQNSKHFAEAFQCPIGSAMNKKNKCELW